MNRLWRRIVTVICLPLLLFTLPGCWDYKRINDRAALIGIGIDPVPDNPKLLKYIFQFPNYATPLQGAQSDAQSSSPSGQAYETISEKAYSLAEASALAQRETSKGLFLGNCQVVVMSSQLTAEQFHRATSELMRNYELDKMAHLVVARALATDVLGVQTIITPANAIDEVLSESLKQHGYLVRTRLWSWWRQNQDIGIDPVMTVIEPTVIEQEHKKSLNADGVLTFKDEKPSGFLTSVQTLGYNYVAGNVYRMSQRFQDGDSDFVITNIQANSKMTADFDGQTPKLNAIVQVTGRIDSEPSYGKARVTEEQIQHYQDVAEAGIKELIMNTFHIAQERQTDIYGFGRLLYLKHPTLRNWVETNWPEQFSKTDLNVEVHVHLTGKGNLI